MEIKDIEKLKAEIKAEILKELAEQSVKPEKCRPFAEVRQKYKKDLFDTYGPYHWDRVWGFIRQLSCYMVGARYVRELTYNQAIKAAAIAEKLCEMAKNREVVI